jgi:HD-GYP domain-containing protein (c-di-GMP phosphodiesterase class II)
VIQDIANDTRMAPWRVEALKRGYASVIALPLQNAGSMLGVLSLYASEPNGFGSEEVSLLTELAGDLSYGVTALRIRDDRLVGLQRLERAMEDTVQAIASTLEMRDAYTAGHQRRVAVISQAIAKEMGLSDDRIHGLRLATIVHDLGKINIPAEILNRPGKLSAIEFAFIKTHPQVGYDILKPVEFPWPIADIVLQHHERLDGSGYPNGLKGDAILLEARILAVADVVESMTSHRPYRPALGLDVALAEIQEGSGKLYDPVVVEACVKLVRGGKLILSD